MVITMPNRTPQNESPANVPNRMSEIPVFETGALGKIKLIGYMVTQTRFDMLKKAA